MKIGAYKLDTHSLVHLLGCYGLTLTLYIIGITWAHWLVFGLGILWECLDAFNYKLYNDTGTDIPFLDRRGADIVDIIVDFTGVIMAFLVWRIL